jgi:hypothetical protein
MYLFQWFITSPFLAPSSLLNLILDTAKPEYLSQDSEYKTG